MTIDNDPLAQVAYALAEQRKLEQKLGIDLTYSRLLIGKTPGLMRQIDYLESIVPRKKPMLIQANQFPDETKIVRLQAQVWITPQENRGRGKHVSHVKVYCWDKPEAKMATELARAPDGYYTSFNFYPNVPKCYRTSQNVTTFEEIVEHLKALKGDWLAGPLIKKGSTYDATIGPGTTRWPSQGIIIQPDMSLLLIVRSLRFIFPIATDLRAPDRHPDAAHYQSIWPAIY